MPRFVSIEEYKADQIYRAKLAELQGDRYRADMHYKAAVDAARIQAQAQNYKTDKETGFKEKELKANKAAKEWSDYGTFLDKKATNKNTREGHLIQGIGTVAKLQGDRRIPTPIAEQFERDLTAATITGDNGKPRKLTDTEKQQRRLAFLSKQSGGTDNLLEMLTGALGNSLGGQQRAIPSVQGTIPASPQQAIKGATVNAVPNQQAQPEMGQPVKQPSLAPGQNWLNPTVPQDKSVPPQGLPYEPNTPEDRVLDQFIKAGYSPEQASNMVPRFKKDGIEGITNPTSATYEADIARLHGQQPTQVTPEQRKAFDAYLQRTRGFNSDTQDMKGAFAEFMADRNNLIPTTKLSQDKTDKPAQWITNKTLTKGTMDFANRYNRYNGEPDSEYDLRMNVLRQAEEAAGMPKWAGNMKQERERWNQPDAKWFQDMLPPEEFAAFEKRLRQRDPSMENAAQGWDVTPKWYDNQPANVVDTKTKFNWYDRAGQDRLARERLASGINMPPVEPPYEEGWSGPASVFRNIVNPRHVFGAMPSGFGGLMPGDRDVYGSESVSPESGMSVDYDRGFGRMFDGEGGPSRLAFRSETPQYSGPTQVAGDPFPPMLKFFSGGYTPEITQGLRDMNQGQHDLGMRMLRALGLVE